MVQQMVGRRSARLDRGNPDGLGTSVEGILAAIDAAWSDAGVAILVDLGGRDQQRRVEMLPANVGPS
jgi:dihydroxyacetone kinase DhaKLM complex PTS-EIIA-like component DhaM